MKIDYVSKMITTKEYQTHEEICDDILIFSELIGNIEYLLTTNKYHNNDLILQIKELLKKTDFIAEVYNQNIEKINI